jgi:putative nucleotidyltransferase with HDIG domain
VRPGAIPAHPGGAADYVSLVDVIEAEILAGNVELPVLPEVALRVREIVARDGALAEIAAVVEREPAYAAALLRYANSVAFAGLRPVADLRQAMTRLGLGAVEQTVLAISARAAFQSRDPRDERLLRALWDHALTTALAARRLAGRALNPELAFLGGLLHDLGKVVVLRCAVDLRAQDPERYQLPEPVLLEFFDALHCRVGDALLESWNIPDEVRDVVRRHHDPAFAPEDLLPAIVACADRVATKLGANLRPDPEVGILDSPAASLLRLDDVKVATLLVDVEDDVARFRAAG